MESYDLAAFYYAYMVDLPVSQVKPFFFFTGDEGSARTHIHTVHTTYTPHDTEAPSLWLMVIVALCVS